MTTQDLGARLFRFVLVADTHVNERDGHSSSPYEANARANARARHVFAAIAHIDPAPAFVMHLGDIVHPVPELPGFAVAVEQFKDIVKDLRWPLHVLPGNHDIGDKRVEWMPAGTICDEHVEQYRRVFGPDYYEVDEGDCRFIALDAQLLNSGLQAEAEQREWFEDRLQASQGRRLFVCLHYPPYVTDRHERGSYDNIDEPARSWLLALVERHRPEALFAGHVHNFWYDRIGPTAMYLLPATSFLRHDYTEFYRVAPAEEYGRGDAGKFGYFVVDVHERGHVAHCVRTHGAELAPGRVLPAPQPRLPAVHTRTNAHSTVGVDLRHPWAELVEIAATGGVQEFERKLARNDYPLLALWEMGVRLLRVPLQDLLDERVRARMHLMREVGHDFLVYGYGLPDDAALDAARGLVSAFEIVLPRARMSASAPGLKRVRDRSAARVYLSKLRMHEDAHFDGSKFSHFINHGFVGAEQEQIVELLEAGGLRGSIDGVSFRVRRAEPPAAAIVALARLREALGVEMLAHMRLAGESPAEAYMDDLATAQRVAQTVFASWLSPSVGVCFDTFMDVDRGYFPRHGFIDRRYDPRPASHVYANLHALLGSDRIEPLVSGSPTSSGVLWGRCAASVYGLVGCADGGAQGWHSPAAVELHPSIAHRATEIRCFDLQSGSALLFRREGGTILSVDRDRGSFQGPWAIHASVPGDA